MQVIKFEYNVLADAPQPLPPSLSRRQQYHFLISHSNVHIV